MLAPRKSTEFIIHVLNSYVRPPIMRVRERRWWRPGRLYAFMEGTSTTAAAGSVLKNVALAIVLSGRHCGWHEIRFESLTVPFRAAPGRSVIVDFVGVPSSRRKCISSWRITVLRDRRDRGPFNTSRDSWHVYRSA